MGDVDYIKELSIDTSILEGKKDQTTKKIAYVRSYVEKWLLVWVNQPNIRSVTFIDAMCNAGIYEDGGLGTAAEVSKLFASFAKQHPSIHFYLYINDQDAKRVETCGNLCEYLAADANKNVSVYWADLEVNDFLRKAATTNVIPGGYGNAVLLFVDPYNARTVHLTAMTDFIRSRYSEILFNWFSSDLTRNKNDQEIIDCFDGLDIPQDKTAARAIADALKVKPMKLAFSFAFRNKMNAELYQIIFVTPSPKGLEKLKDALWEVFHGAQYHRNPRLPAGVQTSLFPESEFEDSVAAEYSYDARADLVEAFSGQNNVPFTKIETFVLEETMLKASHVLTYVLKPLIETGQVKKDGTTKRSNNYKADTYTFPPSKSDGTL